MLNKLNSKPSTRNEIEYNCLSIESLYPNVSLELLDWDLTEFESVYYFDNNINDFKNLLTSFSTPCPFLYSKAKLF